MRLPEFIMMTSAVCVKFVSSMAAFEGKFFSDLVNKVAKEGMKLVLTLKKPFPSMYLMN